MSPQNMPPASPLPDVLVCALGLHPDGAGVSTYARDLLSELPNFVDGSVAALVGADAVAELPPGVTPVCRPPRHGVRRTAQALLNRAGARVVHGLDVDLPLRARAATVSTVHDLSVFDVPWAFPRHRVLGERLVVAAALRRADVVIAVSAFTAERVRARFGRHAVVIPEAPARGARPASEAEVAEVRARYRLPARFVLHVGTIEPRKRLALLAQACERVGVPLVAAGGAGWKASPPRPARLLGYVARRDIPALYGAATVAAYASAYEGFGLPPLEALACGCPVVSTWVPSADLVPGGAHLAKTADVEGLSQALREVLEDPALRRELTERGGQLVSRLSWASAAEQVAAVYKDLGVPARAASPPPVPSPTGRAERGWR
ncbi:MAG: glycosyltransferase family 4 protein [Acidimicrobiales bacterium]